MEQDLSLLLEILYLFGLSFLNVLVVFNENLLFFNGTIVAGIFINFVVLRLLDFVNNDSIQVYLFDLF